MYLAYAGALIGLIAFDRFVLQRRKVNIIQVTRASNDERHVRFAMEFSIGQKLRGCRVSYTLRDKKNPRTVINGKERPLDFSHRGVNNEYLLFNKKLLGQGGDWVLDIKITSDGSRINPLYKYFPIETTYRQEFNLG